MSVSGCIRLFLLMALFLAGNLAAATVSTVNLPELVENSDRIFYGVCLTVKEDVEEGLGLPVSIYRFRVIEALKGVEMDQVITFRQLDSSKGIRVVGLPSYHKGQRVLVFLHADSRLGLTSPVGMLQGVFRPEMREDGEIGLLNAVENANLAHDLNGTQALSAGLSQADFNLLSEAGPITLSDLRSIVEKLEQGSGNQRKVIR